MKISQVTVLVGLAVIGVASQGATISFVGDLATDATVTDCGAGCTLVTDGDYAQFAAVVKSFDVASTSSMTALSFSFGGGTNGAGTPIAEGGFAPYLSLFDNSGNFLSSTYFGTTCPTGANSNSVSQLCYDVLLDGGNLAAGTYQIAISAYLNLSLAENYGSGTLADGFTGLGNLFQGEDLHYAFDVILEDAEPPAPVPEPASFGLLAVGGLVMVLRKKLQ